MSDGDKPRKFKGPIDSFKGSIDSSKGSIDSSKGPIDSSKGSIEKAKGSIDKKKGNIDSGQSSISYLLLLAIAITIAGIGIFALTQASQTGISATGKGTSALDVAYAGLMNFEDDEKQDIQDITEPKKITLEPIKAEAFQDQDGKGTREFDVLDDILKKDRIFAPNCSGKEQCGNIPRNYFLTSTSRKYFDALALEFDVSKYKSKKYNAILRLFVKQGTHRKTERYHYAIYYLYKDSSVCKDTTRPSKCKSAIEIEDDFEGWLEIPLNKKWENGKLSVRLWNILIDKAELYLEEK